MAFLDNFTGTAGTKLASRTGWSVLGIGSASQGAELNASNQVRSASATDDAPLVGQLTGSVDHYVQANVLSGFQHAGGSSYSMLQLRATSRHQSYGVGYVGGNWILFKNNGSNMASAGGTFTAGALLRVEAVGSTIKVFVNGSLVITHTADENLTNTGAGIMAAGVAGNDPVFDNYESGVITAIPDAPTSVTAVAGAGYADVSFLAGDAKGLTITNITVTASTGQTATGTASPIRVNGLTGGVAVTFTVTETTSGGTSAASAPSNSVTPTVPPSPPTGVFSRVEADGDTVYVDITTTNAPTSGTITLPIAGTNPGGAVAQGPTSLVIGSGVASVTWTNVPAGSYGTPVATLTNAGGSNSVTGGAPLTIAGVTSNPPTDGGGTGPTPDTNVPTFTGGITVSGQTVSGFTLTWSAATDDVGVTGYEINNGAGYVDLGLVLTTAFSGKVPSTTYTGSIRAYDAAGNRSIPQNYMARTADTPALPPPAMGGNSIPGKRGSRRQRRG